MTWVGHIACASEIPAYIRLITKQEGKPRLKEADNIKSDLKEIGCENVQQAARLSPPSGFCEKCKEFPH
jgi:hypothetical protein